MENGQRIPRKGRRLGSSRRRQTREPADGQDAPVAPEPEAWSAQADAELQVFFQDCGAQERGFVTREDLADAKFSFLASQEEPQMIFDWVDVEQRGHLSLEEFSSGLRTLFGSSLSTHRLRRRRPLPTRVSVATSFPALEEADAEEREAFLALVGQLGTSHALPEQAELWQLWGKLRQEEPQLAGNLEAFLARMSGRLQEVRADREALELTLRKRDSDHHREVRQLYEEMEQQISREKRQLQAESDSRGLALSSQMQEVLEAKEQEVQKLAEGQRELEARLHHLSDSQQEADSENRQLREARQDLAGQLEEVRGQLQVTRRHLDAARGRVSWQIEEEPSVPRSREKAPSPPAISPEEPPLPGLFGDNDDWSQLLNFSSPPPRALQLSWSPPPTPRDASGPQTPRVVRQISLSKSHALPLGQEPSSGPEGAPRSPPGLSFGTEDGRGIDPEGQDLGPERPVKPRGPEPDTEPGPSPKAPLPWGPGAPAGCSGSLVAAALRVLIPLEAEPAPQGAVALPEGPREPSWGLRSVGQSPPEGLGQGHPGGLREAPGQALRPDGLPASPPWRLEEESKAEAGKPADRSRQDPGSAQAAEAPGLETGHRESPQQELPHAPPPADLPQTPVEASAPGKLSPPGDPLPRAAAGSLEPPRPGPELAEREAQPGSPATAALAEREAGPSEAGEPRAGSRPEDLGSDSGEAGLTLSPGDSPASGPPADPEYLFHVIFLGDSNVGKTSFLHLLHQNAFATGLAATVGVDFRIKTLMVDNKCFALQLWDTAGQERYHSLTRQLLRKADGVVLMYDVTSQESFAHVRYWMDCLQDEGSGQAVVLLLGNKMDCEEERQVPTEAGRQLAQDLGVSFGECSAALGHNILEPMMNLARSLKVQEDRLKGSLVEVASARPPKRAGCCL
ncbi:ras-related protein Rab-44 [Callospermophilus lateralis]|uniref:ras-related protein Rab-44 n=1 Tax=Callospermophilus lateralis TaxID=76772 RepID=UPI0040387712